MAAGRQSGKISLKNREKTGILISPKGTSTKYSPYLTYPEICCIMVAIRIIEGAWVK